MTPEQARRYPKAVERLRDYATAYDAPHPEHEGLNGLLRKLEKVE